MGVEVSRAEVVAFRLGAHSLTERLGDYGLVEATGRCGVQNSPPGSALIALGARVRGVTRERLDEVVAGQKCLLQTWAMRGAPFYVPTNEAAVFTAGVLPPTEASMRHLLPGLEPALGALDMSAAEAVELTGAEIHHVLSGRRLPINALGAETAERVAARLTTAQRSVWESQGPYGPGQRLGEGVVHFCVRILTLQGIVCFAPRAGNTAPLVLVEEWLGHPIPHLDPEAARADLLRRYLHCYGPSTRADFAAWVGVNAGDTGPWWESVEDELTPVGFRGRSWILSEDLERLRSTPQAAGARLLPPRDPYTQMRDHDTIVEKAYHRHVWKTVGDPGTVLVDGEVIGTWRPRKRGRTLTITVSAFGPLRARQGRHIEDEAEQIAVLRGATAVDVVLTTH